jgi:outer membrane protein assembly factor BamB
MWNYSAQGYIAYMIPIISDGILFGGNNPPGRPGVFALNASTGEELFRYVTLSTPGWPVLVDDVLYVTSSGYVLMSS